jgi:hypothetical protein
VKSEAGMNAAAIHRIITKDDQRVLGLLNANGRPVHAADLEGDELLEQGEEQDAAEELEEEALA